MKLKHQKYPFVQLTNKVDITLYLIREELKSYKFFGVLAKLGIDGCFYQPNLDKLILARVGLDVDKEESIEFYITLMEKRSKKIIDNGKSVMKQALKVYRALLAERDRRKNHPKKS
ncbi:hypothetical protein [Chryseolinea lacunae]|uniref:Uncharacterized protein n=1 Tax=Chryseolinea lacunae TaxID=2801331 RepID=A0ABS1KKG0_9BACT|nr:hypothetical protein [Chryseolinea lacunae]MBL0739949.1 hypothetical protein [Chryseolinea lacunae]